MGDRIVVELKSGPSGPTFGTWLPWVEVRWRPVGVAPSGWVADDTCRRFEAVSYAPGLDRDVAKALDYLLRERSHRMCQPDMSSVVRECVRQLGLGDAPSSDVRLTRRTEAQGRAVLYRGPEGLVGPSQSALAIRMTRSFLVAVIETGFGILGTRALVPDMRGIGLRPSDAQRLAEEALRGWEETQRQRC